MNVKYPCSLPGPLVNNYSFKDSDQVVYNDLSSGPPVARLQSSQGYSIFNVVFSFNALQFQVFRAFYRSELKFLSKTFEIDLIIDGFDGEDNAETHICYMRNLRVSLNSKRWSINATLISIDQRGLDLCDSESLVNLHEGMENINKNILEIEDLINVL